MLVDSGWLLPECFTTQKHAGCLSGSYLLTQRAAKLRQLQSKLATSPSHGTLTSGHPVLALFLYWMINVPATASVSQGRICSDNFTCCRTETEVADPTFHLTQSKYTDTGPTSPIADPIMPGAWQGSHWSANF